MNVLFNKRDYSRIASEIQDLISLYPDEHQINYDHPLPEDAILLMEVKLRDARRKQITVEGWSIGRLTEGDDEIRHNFEPEKLIEIFQHDYT